MKPDRQDAVMCRLYDAQKSLTAAKRRAARGKLDYAREEIMALQHCAWHAKEASSQRILVTHRVVVETWAARPDENGYGHDNGITLTEDSFNVVAPKGLLVTGLHAVQKHLQRIFFAFGYFG